MSDPLLIAATPELLAGWSGPVLAADGVPGVLVGPDQRPEDERRGLWVVCPVGEWPDLEGTAYSEMPMSCLMSEVFLDLRRAEVRDRVARVLRQALRARGSGEDFDWPRSGDWWAFELYDAIDNNLIDGSFQGFPTHKNDDTRLADGSRHVDALALAVVAREVCGV